MQFDEFEGEIWRDGHFVPWAEAKIHVLTHSLHFASGVFEGIRAYDGVPFRLAEHVSRLFRSAELVDIEIPFDQETIAEACTQSLAKNGISDGYIRPIVWRGPNSMAPGAMDARIHVAIAAWEWPDFYGADAVENGIRLTIADWRRPSPETAPTASKASGLYQICTLAKHDAQRRGFDDALILDYRGLVAETTSSNIFFVMGERLVTPIADCFLDGITRQTVISIAPDLGIELHESHLSPSILEEADEVFITGTAAEVTPVRSIDDHDYRIGPLTHRIAERFRLETLGGA